MPYKRPVAAVSWCPDGGSKIAIAYCNLEFQATHPDTTKESYVFNVGKILSRNGILLPKLFWPTVRKNCSSDREKLLKFEAEGWEFAKFLRSL